MEEKIERIVKGERIRQGKKILDNIEITPEQQKTLRAYSKYLVNQGRTFGTREQYLSRVVNFVPFLEGRRFEEVTREDFSNCFYALRDRRPATKENAYVVLHRFFGWLGEREGEDNEEKYIKILGKERYKRPKGEKRIIKGEDLPTQEEIDRIIKFAMNPRDKAMISMSFDLGTRPKELLGLNVGDVNFDELGAVVTVGEHAKTGARTLRLITSLQYLREWLESHPYRDNKEVALFIGLGRNQFGKRITPQTLRWAFKAAAKLAGVDRRVYTYLLRHASITREAGNGLGDQQLKVFYGWSPSSRMLEIYSHLSSEDVNKKRLEQAGVIKPKQKVVELKQRKCPRCGAENTPTADFCSKCASSLDESKFRKMLSKDQELKELEDKIGAMEAREEARAPYDEKMTELMKLLLSNPEIKELVKKERKEVK